LLAEKRCLIQNYRAIALHEDFPTRKEKKRKKRGGKSECAWREKKRKISNI